jgi:hypothetical protein
MSTAEEYDAAMSPLVVEYDAWLEANASMVPRDWDFSADNLVLHDDWFSLEQRQWLTDYIMRWDAKQKSLDL